MGKKLLRWKLPLTDSDNNFIICKKIILFYSTEGLLDNLKNSHSPKTNLIFCEDF